MARCTHYDVDSARNYLRDNPHASREEAMDMYRCGEEAESGHTRCVTHGAGDILFKYLSTMREDERDEFTDLYKNMVHKYDIDETNLYIANIAAMCCKEIVMASGQDKAGQMLEHIRNAVALGRDLAITPKEQKSDRLVVTHTDASKDAADIEAIVDERMKRSNQNDKGTVPNSE